MGWEKPVVDAIRDQYGDVELTEEQRRTVSAQFLVQFMRDARQVLDDVGRKKDKRLELSAWVWPWDDGYSPQFHVDYRSMMKEHLLDSVIIHQAKSVNEKDMKIAHAHGCKYFIMPDNSGAELAQTLIDGYAQGIDGAAEWDIGYPSFDPPSYGDRWKYLKVAGDTDQLKKTIASQDAPAEDKPITIHKINGKSVSGKDLWQACYAGG